MYFNNRCNCNNYNDYDNHENYYHDERKNCCIKRTEEVLYCFPSYYNEDKKDNCKKDNNKKESECKYWEGTFKIYPKYEDSCNKYESKENSHNSEKRNNCCFCNLFKNSRW